MDEGRHSRKDGDQLLSYSAMGPLRTTMFGPTWDNHEKGTDQ